MDMDGMQRLSRKRLLIDAAWEKCIEASPGGQGMVCSENAFGGKNFVN